MRDPVLVHDRYACGALLGQGAQGAVVRVTDREAPARALVAKLWLPGVFEESLLEGEFALLSRADIPGLVRAHDFGRDARDGAPFVVEDFADGPDARSWIAAAPDERARALRLGCLIRDITTTLADLHDSGFVHGDLKPEHVRVVDGRPVLLDLGAAVRWTTSTRVEAITAGYAAPELLGGGKPSPRSDLYALAALAYSVATGAPPAAGARDLRRRARWIPPQLSDIVERALSPHPEDRQEDARSLLGELAAALFEQVPSGAAAGRALGALVRPGVLAELMTPRATVRYLSGPSGSGKSHVLDELSTAVLLSGRAARRVRFPHDDPALVWRLLSWLRGSDEARPFARITGAPLLLLLDDVELGPADLVAALESFRCRPDSDRSVDIIVGIREPPAGAPRVELPPLDEAGVVRLCRELGVEADAAALLRASSGNPGWIVAQLGRVPLTRALAVERARTLSAPARALLAQLALAGGVLPDSLAQQLTGAEHRRTLAELARASLIEFRALTAQGTRLVSLAPRTLTAELADALGSHDLVDALVDVLLDDDGAASVAVLMNVARAPHAPTRRSALLRHASERARAAGLRAEQTALLLESCADPAERSAEVLTELDRITRGGGNAGAHPELVDWLAAAARDQPGLGVLAVRRRAERCAREGDLDAARELATRAVALAEETRDPADLALARATEGAVALYRADWASAERALDLARSTMASGVVQDQEELARLDHNLGVVALYRGKLAVAHAAFERSIAAKRRLGDRAGVAACLLNLGLTLAELDRVDEADRALEEAQALSVSVARRASVGWCLCARADVAVRRRQPQVAERLVAEAEHLVEALPGPVKADLTLIRAEIALLEGDARGAERQLSALDSELRSGDALIGLRAQVVEARIALHRLPAEPRRAARLAVAAIRGARAQELPAVEKRAREVLKLARASHSPQVRYPRPTVSEVEGSVWSWLQALASDQPAEASLQGLGRMLCEQAGAERVFLARLDASSGVKFALGIDLDGLAIADPARRIDPDALAEAERADGAVYQPRVQGPAGTGSRLVALGPRRDSGRVALVLEHRFVPGRFDAVAGSAVDQWVTLVAVAFRLLEHSEAAPTVAIAQPPAPVAAARDASRAPWSELTRPPARRADEPSTVLPSRAARRAFDELVGQSAAFQRALNRLDAAIDSDLPVLITGETGVGKELFARALHQHGARARAPFVAVNCAAIADSLFEAELFGHAKGSFTGAERARAGLLSQAEGGTLFLDEIGELPLLRQASLLRTLASRTYRAVGAETERSFDVRIVAATNRDLAREVSEGRFRRDLLYRLNVLEIHVPPLRERKDDIPRIAAHVLANSGTKAKLSRPVLAALSAYDWPGNVRELEHQMQRVAAVCHDEVHVEHLAREIRGAALRRLPARPAPATPDAERDEVVAALAANQGNITHTAERLGMTRQGLKKKMARLGLRSAPHLTLAHPNSRQRS